VRAQATVYEGHAGDWSYKIWRSKNLVTNGYDWFASRNRRDAPAYIKREYLTSDGFSRAIDEAHKFEDAEEAERAVLMYVGVEELSK
jgi:hypothetical protein